MTGGAPQLVGMFRSGRPESIGVVYRDILYLRGRAIEAAEDVASEWRNQLFERCDPRTKTLLHGAQRHARPKGL